MRIGPWKLEALNDRFFALDGGAMFGVVPRGQWAKVHPPDEAGRIKLAARCLLARHDDGRILLVEAGMGVRWMGRARAAYAVDEGGGLVEALARRGIGREDVTDIVVTHLHFDHAGGLVSGGAGKGLSPTYPRARVHVQAEHLAWAESPSPRDRASFRAADYRPLREAGLLELHEGPGEVVGDLEARVSHGHTPAMQIPVFRGDEGAVVYPSDLIPTAAHAPLPWVMAYDNQPLVTVEEKRALLEEASAERWVLVPDHDPEIEAFTVHQEGGRFEVERSSLQ